MVYTPFSPLPWRPTLASKYHLYSRSRTGKDGKSIKRWYYWYWGEDGRRIRKAAGENNVAPLLKRDAQNFIDNLDKPKVALSPTLSLASSKPPLFGAPKSFKDFAKTLFLPGAEHLKRRTITDGGQIKEATRLAHLGRLNNYIIPRWGSCSWTVFEDEEFAENFLDWLVDLKRVSTHREGTEVPAAKDMSNSLRNNITETMAISFRLAKRKHYLRIVPEFIQVKRFSKHQNTLTNEDLARLFPL